MANFESRNGRLYIDGKIVLRGWESSNGMYWFAIEKVDTQTSVINGKNYSGDTIWYGYVQGQEEEWRNFSQKELELMKNKVWKIPQKNLPFSGRRN